MTLQLHMFPTLNAHKVTIALEEMELAYDIVLVDIRKGDQTSPEFLALSPNGRMPALVDPDAPGGPVRMFESAAIMQYLGRKTGLFFPADEQTRTWIDSWLFWQMSGLGPQSGNYNWFTRAAAKEGRDPAETSLAIHRFEVEVSRLFDVLERGLAGRDWLAGAYSIADMCCFTWIHRYPENGGGLASRPALAAWHDRIAQRPAVQRALLVGRDLVKD